MSLTDSNGNRTWAKFLNESETLPPGQDFAWLRFQILMGGLVGAQFLGNQTFL